MISLRCSRIAVKLSVEESRAAFCGDHRCSRASMGGTNADFEPCLFIFCIPCILQVKEAGFPELDLKPFQRNSIGTFVHASSAEILETFWSTSNAFGLAQDWEIFEGEKLEQALAHFGNGTSLIQTVTILEIVEPLSTIIISITCWERPSQPMRRAPRFR